MDAILQLQYGWKKVQSSRDPTTYYVGEIQREGRNLSVVAACAQRKGMASAAALAAKISFMFRPKYLVMTGICAGIPEKTNLGDIVVADPTWDWGSGKKAEDGKGSPVFKSAPHQMPLDAKIAQVAVDMSRDASVISQIRAGWQKDVPKGTLSVHVGPMASGGSVIADSTSAESIIEQHKDLLAIEMEAYAVMAAAEYSDGPKPLAVVIKSVCDFADPDKGNDWQEYASYTSARFADLLFRNGAVPI